MTYEVCRGRIVGPGWTQEHYSSRPFAVARARRLKKQGYRPTVGDLGPQVTRVGLVRIWTVTVMAHDVPPPQHVEPL